MSQNVMGLTKVFSKKPQKYWFWLTYFAVNVIIYINTMGSYV